MPALFGRESESTDLAEVAQQVLATEGPKPLEWALRDLLLNTPVEPSPIHHALAQFARTAPGGRVRELP